jgi:hypothetical protein
MEQKILRLFVSYGEEKKKCSVLGGYPQRRLFSQLAGMLRGEGRVRGLRVDRKKENKRNERRRKEFDE